MLQLELLQLILMPMICNSLVALRPFLSWFFVRSLIKGLSGFIAVMGSWVAVFIKKVGKKTAGQP